MQTPVCNGTIFVVVLKSRDAALFSVKKKRKLKRCSLPPDVVNGVGSPPGPVQAPQSAFGGHSKRKPVPTADQSPVVLSWLNPSEPTHRQAHRAAVLWNPLRRVALPTPPSGDVSSHCTVSAGSWQLHARRHRTIVDEDEVDLICVADVERDVEAGDVARPVAGHRQRVVVVVYALDAVQVAAGCPGEVRAASFGVARQPEGRREAAVERRLHAADPERVRYVQGPAHRRSPACATAAVGCGYR